MQGRQGGRKEVVLPLQQSVDLAFTVAEQSGRHSQPAGSTWHAISSAPGTLAQPAQPKHTSTGNQNNAKQTHTGHTEYMRACVWCVRGNGADGLGLREEE